MRQAADHLVLTGDELATVGDLPDRETLELAVMPRQGDRPATLENPTRSRG